jgi:hypothetical protein
MQFSHAHSYLGLAIFSTSMPLPNVYAGKKCFRCSAPLYTSHVFYHAYQISDGLDSLHGKLEKLDDSPCVTAEIVAKCLTVIKLRTNVSDVTNQVKQISQRCKQRLVYHCIVKSSIDLVSDHDQTTDYDVRNY